MVKPKVISTTKIGTKRYLIKLSDGQSYFAFLKDGKLIPLKALERLINVEPTETETRSV